MQALVVNGPKNSPSLPSAIIRFLTKSSAANSAESLGIKLKNLDYTVKSFDLKNITKQFKDATTWADNLQSAVYTLRVEVKKKKDK